MVEICRDRLVLERFTKNEVKDKKVQVEEIAKIFTTRVRREGEDKAESPFY